jgi:hypothetical protein
MAPATISPSDLAPAETVHYSFAGSEFDLDAGGTYETDNEELIGGAIAHPWLVVERQAEEAVDEDGAPLVVEFPHTAIEAGLDQKDVEFAGEEDRIAETLAADDVQDDVIVTEVPDDEPVEPVKE